MKLLKPCPCCGGEAMLVLEDDLSYGLKNMIYAKCSDCGMRTEFAIGDEHDCFTDIIGAVNYAISTWNLMNKDVDQTER